MNAIKSEEGPTVLTRIQDSTISPGRARAGYMPMKKPVVYYIYNYGISLPKDPLLPARRRNASFCIWLPKKIHSCLPG
jgi:hypothetical protein